MRLGGRRALRHAASAAACPLPSRVASWPLSLDRQEHSPGRARQRVAPRGVLAEKAVHDARGEAERALLDGQGVEREVQGQQDWRLLDLDLAGGSGTPGGARRALRKGRRAAGRRQGLRDARGMRFARSRVPQAKHSPNMVRIQAFSQLAAPAVDSRARSRQPSQCSTSPTHQRARVLLTLPARAARPRHVVRKALPQCGAGEAASLYLQRHTLAIRPRQRQRRGRRACMHRHPPAHQQQRRGRHALLRADTSIRGLHLHLLPLRRR